MAAMPDDNRHVITCRGEGCEQVVFKVTRTGAVYPVGEAVRIERDGRLTVMCPVCGERNRYTVVKRAA